MTECYRCGQEGHRRADCPQATPLPAPESCGQPAKPPPVPPRIHRDPELAREHAHAIRQALGWLDNTNPGDDNT